MQHRAYVGGGVLGAVVVLPEALARDPERLGDARKQPADKKALAQRLVTLAGQTTDDPAARYVMLRDARDFATELNEAATAVLAIDAMSNWYDINPGKLKVETLEKIAAAQTGAAPLRATADLAAAAADASFEEDDYESAVRLAQVAATAGRKAGLTAAALEEAEFRLAEAKRIRDEFAAVQPAVEVLKTTPDDPTANLAVGRFRYFTQGRWTEGVKLLARGNDAALKGIAELEASAAAEGPVDGKLADQWFEYAQKAGDAQKWVAEKRARFWYARAMPGLTGLAKARADGRMGFTAKGIDYRPGLVAEFTAKTASVLKGVKTRVEPGIDFSAGEFRDAAKQTDVTVRWSGVIVPPRPGGYRFVATTNDPVRVRVDGKPVIDVTAAKGGRNEATVTLHDRPTAIAVEFTAPNTDSHTLKLTWVPHGGTEAVAIPPECLFHDRKAASGK